MRVINILLVDDEIDLLEVMEARIKSWGYNVIKASSGKEAISAIIDKNPDIIILDYMMPEMDGFATLKEIRKIGNMPVIMFTAYPDMKTIKGTEELGVSAFIPKLSAYSDVQFSLKMAIGMLEKRLTGNE